MRQRLHTTICRRTLTLLGLVGLAALLVLPAKSLAGEGTPPSGPLTEVQVQPEDFESAIVPNDVVGGVSVKVPFGFLAPGGYILTITAPFATPFARVFASASEGSFFGGALFAVNNVIPQFGAVQVVVFITSPYVPQVFVDLLVIP
jgi:hypothetical protein